MAFARLIADNVRGNNTHRRTRQGDDRTKAGGARATVLRHFARAADDWTADAGEKRTRRLEGRLGISVERTVAWSGRKLHIATAIGACTRRASCRVRPHNGA